MAIEMLAKDTFIPTALAMSPDGTLTTNETPITQQNDEEIAQEILALRRTFGEEARAGRLAAYGVMMLTDFDVPNSLKNVKAVAYFFEHECGEGIVMHQTYEKKLFRKVKFTGQYEDSLPESFRIWESAKPAAEPVSVAASPATAAMTETEAQKIIAQIPEFAESQRRIASDVFNANLDYSAESIAKLDGIIADGWPDEPPVLLEEMVMAFGSYFGETIRRVHGGNWRYDTKHGLHFEVGGIKIFPFTKVRKRFLNGTEDSLGYFYSFIRAELAKGQPPA